MKTFVYLILILFSTVIFSSCEKDYTEEWLTSKAEQYTIPELKSAIGLSQYSCNDTLECEGKYVNVTGYIYGINIFPNESRLLLYSEKNNNISGVFNQEIIGVKISNTDSLSFFNKTKEIYRNVVNPDTVWEKVNIKAQIYGWDMAGNGWCQKSIGLIGHSIDKEN